MTVPLTGAADALDVPANAMGPATKQTIKIIRIMICLPEQQVPDSQNVGTSRVKSIRQVLVPVTRVTPSRVMPGPLSRIREPSLGRQKVSDVPSGGLAHQRIQVARVEADRGAPETMTGRKGQITGGDLKRRPREPALNAAARQEHSTAYRANEQQTASPDSCGRLILTKVSVGKILPTDRRSTRRPTPVSNASDQVTPF
jgi:hypothetical protein